MLFAMTELDWVAMQSKSSMVVIGLAAWSLSFAMPAMAQLPTPTGDGPSSSPPASVRPRIEVNPRPAYRRCASWDVIQYRPSGTVLFPEKHCWWQRW
jgi:hypothetical protein